MALLRCVVLLACAALASAFAPTALPHAHVYPLAPLRVSECAAAVCGCGCGPRACSLRRSLDVATAAEDACEKLQLVHGRHAPAAARRRSALCLAGARRRVH